MKLQCYEYSRSAYATSGVGGDGGERKLADGDGGAVIGCEAGGADAAAAGADGEEVEVVVLGVGGGDREGAAVVVGMGGRE